MRILSAAKLKSFNADASGNIALLFGIAFMPLMIAAGMAIDTIALVNAQAKISKAMDAATLAIAATGKLSSKQQQTLGEDVFYANLPEGFLHANSQKPAFVVKSGKVTGTIEAVMKTGIMGLAGFETMDLDVASEVAIKEKKNAEIALVLDYSDSMNDPVGGEVKYIAMRKAATKLIDDLVALDKDKVKFALVPFSLHVMAPLPGAYVKGVSFTETRLACTQDRPYPANLSDNAPSTTDATKWGHAQAPEGAQGCDGYFPRGLVVTPLSNNFSALKSQLARMVPYALTHIALGAEFGYHVLSSKAPFTGGADYDDKTTEKFMVILTDGRQTAPAFGPNGIRNVEQGRKNLVSICANAKADGIKVISIAYDLDDTETRKNLATCASDKDKFFVVNDGRALASAFDSIKQLLMTEIYISR